MEIKKNADAWRPEIEEVLASKTDEFRLLGYPKASGDDIWACLKKRVWKGNPELFLHQVVADIFHISPGTYMNFLAQKAYQEHDLMESIAALSGKDKPKAGN